MFTIHFSTDQPLSTQIYLAVIEQIRTGGLSSQDRLPSQRALAAHLGVSVNTVKLAYTQLRDEGFIVARERSGFYVDQLNLDRLPPQPGTAEALPPQPGTAEALSPAWKLTSPAEPSPDPWRFSFSPTGIDPESWERKLWVRLAKEAMEDTLLDLAADQTAKAGIWDLRVEIAKYLADHRGVRVHPAQIIVTSSFWESLMILFSLLDRPISALEDPGYLRNDAIFSCNHQEFIPIPLDTYGFSVASLEKTPANVAIVTPTHQFPTGLIMGLRRRQRLLAWAECAPDRYILEDDFDSDFKYSGSPIPALKSLDRHHKVILSGSFSQSLGPFLGVSYLVLPDPLYTRFMDLALPKGRVSNLAQHLLQRFMHSGAFDRHLNRMNKIYRSKRDLFLHHLTALAPDLQISGASAGLYFLASVPAPYLTGPVFADRAEAAQIYLQPLDAFRRQPLNDGTYVLGFGSLPLDRIPAAAAAVVDLIHMHPRTERYNIEEHS